MKAEPGRDSYFCEVLPHPPDVAFYVGSVCGSLQPNPSWLSYTPEAGLLWYVRLSCSQLLGRMSLLGVPSPAEVKAGQWASDGELPCSYAVGTLCSQTTIHSLDYFTQ